MSRTTLALALGLVCTLAACGTDPTERGVSGAGLGAGLGAGIGAITGTSLLGGALLGGAAGGAAGALTGPNTVDLGKPIWDR